MHSALVWMLAALASFQFSHALPADVNTSGRCGPSFGGLTCGGSKFGACCSKWGFCGVTADHCDVPKGCQSSYGTCTVAKISKDGSCGGTNEFTCLKSSFGSCCRFVIFERTAAQAKSTTAAMDFVEVLPRIVALDVTHLLDLALSRPLQSNPLAKAYRRPAPPFQQLLHRH